MVLVLIDEDFDLEMKVRYLSCAFRNFKDSNLKVAAEVEDNSDIVQFHCLVAMDII